MHVTFLVTLNLDDLSDLPSVAGEIEDDLDNFEVISVAPWARPTLTEVAPIVPTTQTTNTIQ